MLQTNFVITLFRNLQIIIKQKTHHIYVFTKLKLFVHINQVIDFKYILCVKTHHSELTTISKFFLKRLLKFWRIFDFNCSFHSQMMMPSKFSFKISVFSTYKVLNWRCFFCKICSPPRYAPAKSAFVNWN